MLRPELKTFGLSAVDVAEITRTKDGITFVIRAVAALLGAAAAHFRYLQDGTDPFSAGVLLGQSLGGGVAGLVVGLLVEDRIVRLIDERFERYERYQQALWRFEDWERRTQAEYWQALSGREFERELARLFSRLGYEAQVIGGPGDRGVDIVLERANRTTVVQCKCTRTPVGLAVAREFSAAFSDYGAAYGILATVGGVTPGVHEYFRGKPLTVMDLSEIIRLQRSLSP